MASKDKLQKVYMNIAKEISSLSYCKRKQVGCVIVRDNNILSFGYNGTPTGFDNDCERSETDEYLNNIGVHKINYTTRWYVLHAESNALMKIATQNQSSVGSTLYTTMSPCKECAKLIIQAGITTIVYKEVYRNEPQLAYEAIDLLKQADIAVYNVNTKTTG
jgi:dCMP deaminase